MRNAQTLLSDRTGLLTKYTARWFKESSAAVAFSIDEWEDIEVVTGKEGNASIERWITIRVGQQELYSCWTAAYPTGVPELTPKQKRKIRVNARSFADEKKLGIRYDATESWQDRKQRVFIHFDDPAPPGSLVRIWVRWTWPGYHKRLLLGSRESFEWVLRRPTKRIKTTVTFDKKAMRTSRFAFSAYPGCPLPKLTENSDGSVQIEAEYLDLDSGARVGFWLDGQPNRA